MDSYILKKEFFNMSGNNIIKEWKKSRNSSKNKNKTWLSRTKSKLKYFLKSKCKNYKIINPNSQVIIYLFRTLIKKTSRNQNILSELPASEKPDWLK